MLDILASLPCSLPHVAIPADIKAEAIALSFEERLKNLTAQDFVKDALWRDTFALTGTLRTIYSGSRVSIAWRETTDLLEASSFVVDPNSSRVTRIGDVQAWVDVPFTFRTYGPPATICSRTISLVPSSAGKWKIWLLRTILEELKGQESVDTLEPCSKSTHDLISGSHFDCVVVGGGPSGLSTAGRLQALGVSYVMLDKNKDVGDCWKGRYNSTRSHLPFGRTFPATYQELLTKDDLARGYQDWASRYGINVSLETTLVSGEWERDQRQWRLHIIRQGRQEMITSSYVVFAAGAGGRVPMMPTYPGKDDYKGIVLHSAEYKDAMQWKGKHGVVIGTANTAHDVAEDMLEAGLASITMIQRSRTYVLPYEYLKAGYDRIYNASIPTEQADRLQNSSPYAVSRLLSQATLYPKARKEPERFRALEARGFKVDPYGDVITTLFGRLGGHYMDVGNCANIAQGRVQVKSDALPTSYTSTGLSLSDGTSLPADVIVFATGFKGNMRSMVQEIFGAEVADLAGDFWGFDSEGEIKGAFGPTGHPAFWYLGGTLGSARYFSRFIALQIKAKLLGTPLRVYDKCRRAY